MSSFCLRARIFAVLGVAFAVFDIADMVIVYAEILVKRIYLVALTTNPYSSTPASTPASRAATASTPAVDPSAAASPSPARPPQSVADIPTPPLGGVTHLNLRPPVALDEGYFSPLDLVRPSFEN